LNVVLFADVTRFSRPSSFPPVVAVLFLEEPEHTDLGRHVSLVGLYGVFVLYLYATRLSLRRAIKIPPLPEGLIVESFPRKGLRRCVSFAGLIALCFLFVVFRPDLPFRRRGLFLAQQSFRSAQPPRFSSALVFFTCRCIH